MTKSKTNKIFLKIDKLPTNANTQDTSHWYSAGVFRSVVCRRGRVRRHAVWDGIGIHNIW